MEMVLNNGFCEMSQDELNVLDGGAIIELTIGAKIAIALFGTGTLIGIGHAIFG